MVLVNFFLDATYFMLNDSTCEPSSSFEDKDVASRNNLSQPLPISRRVRGGGVSRSGIGWGAGALDCNLLDHLTMTLSGKEDDLLGDLLITARS